MTNPNYLMESEDESLRLELKTDENKVLEQAVWAGIKAGMQVADLGCGPGKTTLAISKIIQPGGEITGVDFSEDRIRYALEHYKAPGMNFCCRDIRMPLDDLGRFDFVWVRFVLEYYLTGGREIVENALKILKPGGTICLIDLDNNCLNHYGIPARLERTIREIMSLLQERSNFDPYAGRKLYSFLYDLGLQEIDVSVAGHHVIYGRLEDADAFNWLKKAEVAPKKVGYGFAEYPGGYDEFLEEFKNFFHSPRRFTYSPIILCKAVKPSP
ncbi:MAG: methyltransferase domain-containing protein [Proteobacteria bacterium]|nr:methyltransferase domain-containing protein [Pseudomonadota bacterium]MBU1739660.1 methyltransferase domain-containing protein [Pseudomonadota bacterium]